MKHLLYPFVIGTLIALGGSPAQARTSHRLLTDSPTEQKATVREKAAASKKAAPKHSAKNKKSLTVRARHSMRVLLGLEPRKVVTSPHKLERQLHANQRQLRVHNRMASRSRWRLCN